MKKIITFTLLVAALVISGCHSGEGADPKTTLVNFFTALGKKDVEAAKKYATADSEGMLNMMSMGFSSNVSSDHSDKMIHMVDNAEFGNPVINGDEATVNVKDKKTGESADFLLKKENGSWKVAFDMGTLMNMASKKMKEHNIDIDSLKNSMGPAMDGLKQHLPEIKDKIEHAKEKADSAMQLLQNEK